MGRRHEPTWESLALARKHVRTLLTDDGLSRQALLHALLERDQPGNEIAPLRSKPSCRLAIESNVISRAKLKTRDLKLSDSTDVQAHDKGDRPPPSPGHVSTCMEKSGHRNSCLFSQTPSSPRSSDTTQVSGAEPFSASTRAYWCTSCDAEFKRKFDWKRHEDEFHERYKKYPCPDCNRVFWGANTFNQHHKTRHGCGTCPHADKVISYTRKKRAWACGFCAAFLPSMDRYIDHIGLHYEAGRTKAHWYHSNVIYGLLHQPGVNVGWKSVIDARFGHIPKYQQPRYGWDPKTTGRKPGFLENESAGNLQDLLEFFNPTKDDPMKVARLAFELAEMTPASRCIGRYMSMSGLDAADKSQASPPPPWAPPRGASKSGKSSKRIFSRTQEDVVPPLKATKSRPTTRCPRNCRPTDVYELPGSKASMRTADKNLDATALPQPLFTDVHSRLPERKRLAHDPVPSIAMSTASDPPPYSSAPPSPISCMPRDTVIDILNSYILQNQFAQSIAAEMHDIHGLGIFQQYLHHQHSPSRISQCESEDWTSVCLSTTDDIDSPRASSPLAPAYKQLPPQPVYPSNV